MDATKTMRELCEAEPDLPAFLVARGFPFSLDNPIVDLVTLADVAAVQELDLPAFTAAFEEFKRTGDAGADGTCVPTAAARAMAGLGA